MESMEHNEKKEQNKPTFMARLILQISSLVLSLVLAVSLLATALLADVLVLTSSGGIEKILNHMVSPTDPAPDPSEPAMGAAGVILLASPDNAELSADMLPDSNFLTEYVYALLQEALGDDIPITPEQVQYFIEESTIVDFVADKSASLVQDMLNGTQTTTVTAEELRQLMDENEQVIEETFQVEITEEMKQDMVTKMEEAVVDTDINATLRSGVERVLQMPVPGTGGMTVSDLLAIVQQYTKTQVLMGAIAICLVLMLALCGLNYYCLPKGLRWSASSCMFAGALLSIPLAMVQAAPSLLADVMPETSETLSLFYGATNALAPVHYGLLVFGVALMIVSAFLRIATKD